MNEDQTRGNQSPEPVKPAGSPSEDTPAPADATKKKWQLPTARGRLITVLLLAVILVGAVVYLAFFKGPTTSKPSSQVATNYNYTKSADEFKLNTTITPGRGMIVRPLYELTLVNHPTDYRPIFSDYIAADFAHRINGLTVSSMSILIDLSKQSPSTDYISSLQKAMAAADPSDSVYAKTSKTITSFVTSGVSPKWQLTLDHPVAFTNPTIKVNAWIFDYNLVNQEAIAAGKDPDANLFQGKLVYAVGKGGEYYLAVNALGSNLQNNQTLFQEILDSLKIDQ
jgi:hypothetical protein